MSGFVVLNMRPNNMWKRLTQPCWHRQLLVPNKSRPKWGKLWPVVLRFHGVVCLGIIMLVSTLQFWLSSYTVWTFPLLELTSPSNAIQDTLLSFPNISATLVWKELLREASHQLEALPHSPSETTIGVAMEVGMHSAVQCLQAARAGLHAHCVEPSPISMARVATAVNASDDTVRQRVHLYQAAAGTTSHQHVDFVGSGSTGDHVGDFDVWNMVAGPPVDPVLAQKQGATIQVPTIRLDDIVNKINERVFLLKVDTQGYEPAVLSGLGTSLAQHKVSFALIEYWPAGMDLIMGRPTGTCLAMTLVQDLIHYGYTIYALPGQAHPVAPEEARRELASHRIIPVGTVEAHCRYFYDLARRHPSETYHMGYWSDILAVAPHVTLPTVVPKTALANVLLGQSHAPSQW